MFDLVDSIGNDLHALPQSACLASINAPFSQWQEIRNLNSKLNRPKLNVTNPSSQLTLLTNAKEQIMLSIATALYIRKRYNLTFGIVVSFSSHVIKLSSSSAKMKEYEKVTNAFPKRIDESMKTNAKISCFTRQSKYVIEIVKICYTLSHSFLFGLSTSSSLSQLT